MKRPSNILFLLIVVGCLAVSVVRDGWMVLVYGLLLIPLMFGILALGILVDGWWERRR